MGYLNAASVSVSNGASAHFRERGGVRGEGRGHRREDRGEGEVTGEERGPRRGERRKGIEHGFGCSAVCLQNPFVFFNVFVCLVGLFHCRL